MKTIESIYCDYLYDCYISNQSLDELDWEYYGRENHHTEIPKRDKGVLTPLNSQYLTTYQHWICGVLQSEILGKICFWSIPRGVLPDWIEELRIKWCTHHNRSGIFPKRDREFYVRMGRLNKGVKKTDNGYRHSEETMNLIRLRLTGLKRTEETKELMRQNCFRIDDWFWITNGVEEKMIPPEQVIPEGWNTGRKTFSEETRQRMGLSKTGEKNNMYGVEPKSKKMRWYKNSDTVPDLQNMFIPGEEPPGWVLGRLKKEDRVRLSLPQTP